MTEPIPCPSCGALLRIPEGAQIISCPGCKTILAVEADEAPPPPPGAAPLPFGPAAARAKRAAPAPAPARAAPPKPVARTVRARVVADELPPGVPEAVQTGQLSEEQRRRDIKRQIAELELEERREKKRYEQLATDCYYGRVSLQLFMAGALSSTIGAVFYIIFGITTLTSTPMLILFTLAGVCTILHWLTTIAGFGFACAGPRQARGLSVAGIIVTILNAILSTLSAFILTLQVRADNLDAQGARVEDFLAANMLLSNAYSNLIAVTDMPFYLLSGLLDRPQILILPILGGILEFSKLSLLGLMINRYATEGKDPDLAHQGMRFVYRIFGLVLVAASLKPSFWAIMVLAGGNPFQMMWFAIPMTMATQGYVMWWTFSWYAQYLVSKDTIEIVRADRFADTRQQVDAV